MQLSLKILNKSIVKKDPLLFSLKVKDKLMISLIVDNFYHINNLLVELHMRIALSKEISEFKHQLFKEKLRL